MLSKATAAILAACLAGLLIAATVVLIVTGHNDSLGVVLGSGSPAVAGLLLYAGISTTGQAVTDLSDSLEQRIEAVVLRVLTTHGVVRSVAAVPTQAAPVDDTSPLSAVQ